MGALVLPTQWTRQPQVPVGVNWGNPILQAMGANFLVLPSVGVNSFIGSSNPSSITGSIIKNPASLSMVGSGVPIGYTPDANGGIYYNNRPAASAAGNTMAFVFIRRGIVGAGSDNYSMLGVTSNANNDGMILHTGFRSAGSPVCGLTYGVNLFDSVAVAQDTPYFVIAAATPGTSQPIYLKVKNLQTGQIVKDNVGTATNTASGASTWTFMGNPFNLKGYPGDCFLGVMGSQYLPPTLANVWLQNPWQIFAPLQRRIWVGSAAAGGTFKPYWAVNSNQILGTGTYG